MKKEKELKVEILKPFGNLIFKVKIPEQVVANLNNICDQAILEKKTPFGNHLAGNIENEWSILKYVDIGTKDFFTKIANSYIENCNSENRNFKPYGNGSNQTITSFWLNEMKKFEYNPVHFHTNCLLSSILFLKIPDFREKPIISVEDNSSKNFTDGHTEFIHGSFFPGTGFSGNKIIEPVVGDYYVFPASLQHTVYPFGCDGVRRSIAINYSQSS